MSDPLVEDFGDIRVRLEMIEREKLKALAAPLPDAQPNWAPAAGYLADYTDFDPA